MKLAVAYICWYYLIIFMDNLLYYSIEHFCIIDIGFGH